MQSNDTWQLTLDDLPEQCSRNYQDPPPVIISEDRKQRWINSHPEYLREQAEELVNKIRRVPFEEFKQQLLATVDQFNDFLSRQQNKNYAIYFSQPGETSCYWVMALIFDHLTIKPSHYIAEEELHDPLHSHAEIGHVLLIDDAAYSGTRLSSCFNYFRLIRGEHIAKNDNTLANTKFHVLVPFITQRALKLFSRNLQAASLIGRFFYADIMGPCTTPNNNPLLSLNPEECAATYPYFDYKVPIVGTSTIPCLNKPWLLDGTYFVPKFESCNFKNNTTIKLYKCSKEQIKSTLLLDPVIPPYKIKNFEKEQFKYTPEQKPEKPKIT